MTEKVVRDDRKPDRLCLCSDSERLKYAVKLWQHWIEKKQTGEGKNF